MICQRFAQAIRDTLMQRLQAQDCSYHAHSDEELTSIHMEISDFEEEMPFNIVGVDLTFAMMPEKPDEPPEKS